MPQPSTPPPTGAPQQLVVEGILDGRVADAAALRATVHLLSAAGAGRFRLEVTGGRFNVLPEDTQVPGAAFDEDAQATFLQTLQKVVDAAAPGSVETTLRCKMVYADQVAETLFVLQAGQLEPLTRRRPRSVGDAPPLPHDEPAAEMQVRRRELMWVAPVLLLLGAFIAWQTGWIDRVLAARADAIACETGPFGDMLAVAASREWGNYVVTLQRGPGYPETPEALARRRDASQDLTSRAATELVGDGGELFVQLLDAQGEVLAERRTDLRALLAAADGKREVTLPGRIAAHTLRLGLASGKAPK
ncbi:MAG: hypothetical protein H6835_07585 [Planctomycetes bacterium]|nr:hypothetical protein [Planctomycetota bacterium]